MGGSPPTSAATRHRAATASAIQSSSVATSGSSATRTSPSAVPGPAASSPTPTAPGAARSGADTVFASASTCGGLRKLVSRPYSSAGAPSGPGKSVRNRVRLPALAPRQP